MGLVDYTRSKGIYDPEKQVHNIIICGVGSSGSYIAFALSKMGISNITAIDFDKVEPVNVSNQIYRTKDIGKFKVDAIKEIVKDFSDIEINTINKKIDKDFEFDIDLNTIVIFCFDSMSARKLAYNKIKDFDITLIDSRFGGQGFQIYSIDLGNEDDKKFYEETLEKPIKELTCGRKSIIYCILNLASEVCQIVKFIDQNKSYPHTLKRELNQYRFLTDLIEK